jgi:hypothetical protein
MFRITEGPSSGSTVQCLAKNYKNGSIVSVDMDKVSAMATYCDRLCVRACVCVRVCSSLYRKAQPVTIGCHDTDLVHVNGHDRTILVIFNQALYNAP